MFYHKSFSFLLSASLSVCFQLLITLCLVAKKKKIKRSGPFEYSLMDLTGKVVSLASLKAHIAVGQPNTVGVKKFEQREVNLVP